MQNLNVAVIQSNLHWGDIDANLKHHEEHVNQLEDQVDLILLPEMFSTGFIMEPAKYAETESGKAVTWMKAMASKTNAVIGGSLIIEENHQYFNRFMMVWPDRSTKHYDKRHLFRLANEQDVFTGGNERTIIELKGWNVLLNVCYDLRFPVWARNQNDYDLMIYVANWPERRNLAWKTLLQARAIENQAYCIGVNRVGEDGKGINYSGDSSIIHPDGTILLQEAHSECVLEANLSFEEIKDFREQLPFQIDKDQFNIIL
jgi:predicted amidohydrolase